MADSTNRAYLELIKSAISDFDSIYAALVAKGVASYPTVNDDGKTYNTDIPTSAYSGLIGQLYAIKDTAGVSFTGVSTPTITKLNTATPNKATLNNQTGVMTFTGLPEGFITSDSVFTATLTPVPLTIGDFKLDSENKKYVYTPAALDENNNGVIVKDVTIAQGSIELDATAFVHTKTATTGSVSAATITGSVEAGVFGTEFDTKDGVKVSYSDADYISLTIDPTFAVNCGHTITVGEDTGYTFTPGYITSVSGEKLTHTISQDSTIADNDFTVYLKKAALSEVSAAGNIGFGGSDIGSVDEAAYKEYYTISAGATLTVSGKITAGYIDDGTTLGSSNENGDSISSVYYIKKGKVNNVALTADEFKATITDDDSIAIIGNNTVSGAYNIAVTLPNINKSASVEDGYIEAGDAARFSVTGTGSTQYVSIAHGSLHAASNASIVDIGTVTDFSLAAPTDGSAYTEIPLTLAATNVLIADKGFTPGYIGSAVDYSLTGSSNDSASIFVKNQRTTKNNVTLSVYNVVGKDDKGELITENASIFVEAPLVDADKGIAITDYYEVSASSLVTLTAGYLESGTDVSKEEVLYLPKAKLEYIADDEKGNLIQVTTGGYLPAGLLTDISEITGTLDVADVYVSLDKKLIDGKYTVTATYGSESSAGYFDPTKSFHGTSVTIDAGSINTTAAIVSSSFVKAEAKDNGKYTVTVNATGKVNTDVTEGYVLSSDLLVNGAEGKDGADVTFNGNTTFEMNKASISVGSDSAVSVAATPTSFAFANPGDSKYTISVALGDDKKIKAKASTGYILTEDSETELTVTAAAVEYTLKAATVGTISAVEGSNKVRITTDLAEDVTGDYTINLAQNSAVSATAAIGDGYTDATNATGSVAVIADSVTISHGTLGAKINSAANTIAAKTEGLILHDSAADAGAVSFKITATADVSAGVNVTKAGYVKNADAANVTVSSNPEGHVYLSGYNGELNAEETEFVINGAFVVAEGDNAGTAIDSETIQTAGKYLDKNITVSLHADAMGSAVRSELELLRSRLNGNYVSK